MLERNNGIVIRAASISAIEETVIELENAAIVNGCQTTMCLVTAKDIQETCLVPAKIVVTDNAWEVAKSANYQNIIRRVELELAKFLRPQLLRKVANDLGFGFQGDYTTDVSKILNTIYQDYVTYDEMKFLYLGLFSRIPNNIFELNYTEIRTDVLELMYGDEQEEEWLFSTLFLIIRSSRVSLEMCKKRLAGTPFDNLFKRFFEEFRPSYRMYFTVLSLCGAQRNDLSERDLNSDHEVARMKKFLTKSRSLVENSQNTFNRVYLELIKLICEPALEYESDGEIQKNIHTVVSRKFKQNYNKLCIRLDFDEINMPGQ